MKGERDPLNIKVTPKCIKIALAASIFAILFFFLARPSGPVPEATPQLPFGDEEVAVFETELGKMVWRLFPKEAPITVENMKKMVREGHYNNSHLYRAQKQFCLQGGLWNLRKAPFDPIPLEYNMPNLMGYISMARASAPDTASSEFSIMLRDNSQWLSPKGSDKYGYAVFGQVYDGWEVVQKIMTLPTRDSGRIEMLIKPIKILSAYLTKMNIANAMPVPLANP